MGTLDLSKEDMTMADITRTAFIAAISDCSIYAQVILEDKAGNKYLCFHCDTIPVHLKRYDNVIITIAKRRDAPEITRAVVGRRIGKKRG